MAPYSGFFINLDRSADRRTAIESQLEKFGLRQRYKRYSAVDGQTLGTLSAAITAREYACFLSHYRLLEAATDALSTVHVLEDDVCLAPETEKIITWLDREGHFSGFDLIFTDTGIGLDLGLLRKFKGMFDQAQKDQFTTFGVLDFRRTYLFGSSSYLVPQPAIAKVLTTLRRGLDGGMPFDIFLRQEALAGRLRIGCIFPFITTVQLVGTTIADRGNELSREIVALLRYSFFIGRNFEDIPPTLADKLHAHDGDAHYRLIADVLGYAASADFSEF